ncbi:MAG: prenyltransferase/squalene oxidase repeat-containing protein [Pirellulales bacterium]
MADSPFVERLTAAYKTARTDLLAAAETSGHWIGELSSSPLSTATAISSMAVFQQHAGLSNRDEELDQRINELIVKGLRWLAQRQNKDGGWGDTDRSQSNIATTMLVRAAFQLTGAPAEPADMIDRAEGYIREKGGVDGLRKRYGKDKTFAVPILTNCALAGLVSWREVSALRFELAVMPQSVYRFFRLDVVSYAIPALVAVGLARFRHAPPWNPFYRAIRRRAEAKSLRVLEAIQPASGGFLEATPLTSFVVMSLASSQLADHPVTRRGLDFILRSARDDGSWPIDTNLATWVTTLSVNALADGDEQVDQLGCLDWILQCQTRKPHSYTGAAPGGWGWSDLTGSVPDADDTAGALLAISAIGRQRALCKDGHIEEPICSAAAAGTGWLLDLQNRDGGWPTFCRGWGKLPFDRSGTDLTAHAIRALCAWTVNFKRDETQNRVDSRAISAIERGFDYLREQQREDGSWMPLWFGNEHTTGAENPIYGTAKVLLAYRDLGRLNCAAARRGFDWLLAAQDLGGGWGGSGRQIRRGQPHWPSSVEETSLALDTLLADPRLCSNASLQHMLLKGLAWLSDAVEQNQHHEPSPIGFYFAKLWYHEGLYPLIFATSALGNAVRQFAGSQAAKSDQFAQPYNLVSASID